jgi:hypothetical protein
MTSSAATISIAETLVLLDGPFVAVAEGVTEDRYALWLGSGISLGRVDGVRQIVRRVMEFIRSRIDTRNATCSFKTALDRALKLAVLSPEEMSRVDLSRPFSEWPDAESITTRLANNYARLLDVSVTGKPADYLLWDGVDVRSTFANPATEPDVEHLCIATLVLERSASDIATANWDGLVERAIRELCGGQLAVSVLVRKEDLREATSQARLYKFHGCAIRAAADEAHYRALLIGRQSQINGWASQAAGAFVSRIRDLIITKPTLMIGLSAQDGNIQALFAAAEAMMPWPWPGDRPSYVFSEDEVGFDQEGLLRNVYREAFTADNRDEILKSALVRAYAKPLLVALVLYVLFAKLRRLTSLAGHHLDAASALSLQAGIVTVRDSLAATAVGDLMTFVRSLLRYAAHALTLLRNGRVGGTVDFRYVPIAAFPCHRMQDDPGLTASGLCEASVALGLMGIGIENGIWTLVPVDVGDPGAGTANLKTAVGMTKLLLTANSQTALHLQMEGRLLADEEAIVVYSAEVTPSAARSPRGAPGRTGKLGLREVSIRSLLDENATAADLLQRFREEIGA